MSHNVPPYKQAGLYKELAVLKELVDSYRIENGDAAVDNLRVPIVGAVGTVIFKYYLLEKFTSLRSTFSFYLGYPYWNIR